MAQVSKPSVRAMRPPGSLIELGDVAFVGICLKALGAGDEARERDNRVCHLRQTRRFKALGAGDEARESEQVAQINASYEFQCPRCGR